MIRASENIYANESEMHALEAGGTRCAYSDGEHVKKSSCRAAVVFLGVLSLLLLAGLMTLFFFFSQRNSEWDERMVQLRDNLTKELDSRQQDLRRTLLSRGCECWRRFGTRFYYVSAEQRTWQESRDHCKERGADLVIINSKEEQEFLIGLEKSAWIGLTDQDEEDVWKWVDGTKLMNESYWRPLQPDNYGDNENCAEIRRDGNKPLLNWNDLPWSHTNKWICETNDV